ncbi:hypothetical protein A0K93_03090 [Corynebacterium sp. BCW_4722]|nr:hypothetical protein A0K93_03090 [Corynebacterium sp. BCW_4722]
MSSTAHEPQINRTAIYVSLALAVALVLGVVIGARMYFERVALAPVAMPELPAPQADSPKCAEFIAGLPQQVLGHSRAEVADPAPAGTAAWQSSSTERVTLRCGVEMPEQYNEYAVTHEVDGVRWMRVDDVTPQSNLSTWYTVDRSPVVAVTADRSQVDEGDSPASELNAAALPKEDQAPRPAPLADLETAGDAARCDELLSAVPAELAEGYAPVDAKSENTAVWVAEGKDPIVLRCGVAAPRNYGPGAQLTQINEVPWFEDVVLANGTTSAVWYALGRDTDIAASIPQAESNEAITRLTNLIAAHTGEQ